MIFIKLNGIVRQFDYSEYIPEYDEEDEEEDYEDNIEKLIKESLHGKPEKKQRKEPVNNIEEFDLYLNVDDNIESVTTSKHGTTIICIENGDRYEIHETPEELFSKIIQASSSDKIINNLKELIAE